MKVRKGFVSNSSSSSFVVCKQLMTDEQISEYKKFADVFDNEEEYGEYGCYVDEDDYYFSYSGDQDPGYSLYKKLIELGIDKNKICDVEG